MKQNIFLTGPRQIGKSTALRRFLADYPGKIGGFLTRWNPDGETLHMMQAAHPEGFTAGNIIARRTQCGLCPDFEAFDRIGCRLLQEDADLLVMDELGFMEKDAKAFCAAITQCLSGDIPVVGVVRQTGSIFMDLLEQIPNAVIWHLDGSNRDDIPRLLAENYQ